MGANLRILGETGFPGLSTGYNFLFSSCLNLYVYPKSKLALKYLRYLLTAANGKGHGIHSPFVFEFITRVLNDRNVYACYPVLEKSRSDWRGDTTPLSITDFGAGSRVTPAVTRTIASIARSSLKPRKFSQLLFRMVKFYQPQNILELGTSLGLTTSYLSLGNPSARIITMEGAPAVAATALSNFKQLQLDNIKLVEGNFDNTLDPVLESLTAKLDFVFIDGNHRKLPTLQYFQKILKHLGTDSLLIFDDIHWSSEMEAAWSEIKSDPAVRLTIDLFFIGIVFFRKEILEPQHFILRF